MDTKNDDGTGNGYMAIWAEDVELGRKLASGEMECVSGMNNEPCSSPKCLECGGTGFLPPSGLGQRATQAGWVEIQEGYGVLAAVVGELPIYGDEHLLSAESRAFLHELRNGLGETIAALVNRIGDLQGDLRELVKMKRAGLSDDAIAAHLAQPDAE